MEDEEEVPEAPAMLWVEGEAGGRRWDKELEGGGGGNPGVESCNQDHFNHIVLFDFMIRIKTSIKCISDL